MKLLGAAKSRSDSTLVLDVILLRSHLKGLGNSFRSFPGIDLRSRRPGERLPVIALTQHWDGKKKKERKEWLTHL